MGFSYGLGTDTLSRVVFSDDLSQTLQVLRHARARAMSGFCAANTCYAPASSGVTWRNEQLVLFIGDSFDSRAAEFDERFELTSELFVEQDVIFEQLSANVAAPVVWVLKDDDGRSVTITVGRAGSIRYE